MQHTSETAVRAVVIPFHRVQAAPGLTGRDRLDLHHWAASGHRVEVTDKFAMIYRGDEPWAAWAIGRDGGLLLVWDCVTLADIGRFATMPEALAALREGRCKVKAPILANVIPFRPIAPAA